MHVYITSQNVKLCVHRRVYSWYAWMETCTDMYVHRSINVSVCIEGKKCCQELEGMKIHVSLDVYKIRVYANRHRWICASARKHPPRNARSSRALSRCSSAAAVSASRYHARLRRHMCPVSRVNSSFSRVTSSRDAENARQGTDCGTISSH